MSIDTEIDLKKNKYSSDFVDFFYLISDSIVDGVESEDNRINYILSKINHNSKLIRVKKMEDEIKIFNNIIQKAGKQKQIKAICNELIKNKDQIWKFDNYLINLKNTKADLITISDLYKRDIVYKSHIIWFNYDRAEKKVYTWVNDYRNDLFVESAWKISNYRLVINHAKDYIEKMKEKTMDIISWERWLKKAEEELNQLTEPKEIVRQAKIKSSELKRELKKHKADLNNNDYFYYYKKASFSDIIETANKKIQKDKKPIVKKRVIDHEELKTGFYYSGNKILFVQMPENENEDIIVKANSVKLARKGNTNIKEYSFTDIKDFIENFPKITEAKDGLDLFDLSVFFIDR